MAQNLTIAGASYEDVGSILVAKTGGGYAEYTDTFDGTATAEDILAPKSAYVNGVKVIGTGTGGGGSSTKYGVSIDNWLGELNANNQLQQVTGGNIDLVITDIQSLASYSLYYKFH